MEFLQVVKVVKNYLITLSIEQKIDLFFNKKQIKQTIYKYQPVKQ